MVGARRLQHLRYLANDSLFARFCGLARIPSDRTVVNWLKQFTQPSLRALMRLNSELLYEQIAKLGLRRLTIDLDGTVIRAGSKEAWAARGFNPLELPRFARRCWACGKSLALVTPLVIDWRQIVERNQRHDDPNSPW